jgi:hypothetical protein
MYVSKTGARKTCKIGKQEILVVLSQFPNPKPHIVLIPLTLALYVLSGTYMKTMKQRDATAVTTEPDNTARDFPAESPDKLCSAGAASVDRRGMLKLVLLKRVVGVGSAARFVMLLEQVVVL